MMSQQAVKLGYANPAELDVDSTVQEANIAVLGFNLRQLTRHIAGEVRPKNSDMKKISANNAEMDKKSAVRVI
jgi:hypothetical protein